MKIKLIKAQTADVVTNLFHYYIYDMSEYMAWNPNEHGSFAVDLSNVGLQDYWTKPDHHAFHIYCDNELAGFVLIRKYPDDKDRYDIGQFFVLRRFKRQGVGASAFNAVMDLFPGKWLTRVLPNNSGAKQFWTSVISHRTGHSFTQSTEMYLDKPMEFIRYEISPDFSENSMHITC